MDFAECFQWVGGKVGLGGLAGRRGMVFSGAGWVESAGYGVSQYESEELQRHFRCVTECAQVSLSCMAEETGEPWRRQRNENPPNDLQEVGVRSCR